MEEESAMSKSELIVVSRSAAKLWRMWLLMACGFGGLMLGCDGGGTKSPNLPATSNSDQGAAVHEHEPPASYADAIQQLETLRNTIRDAFAKNDPEAAHGPLHDVGDVLEALPALADKAGFDAAQKDTMKAAMEQLFGHFGKVDEMMHGEKGTKYEDVSSNIDKAVATLAGLTPAK